MPDVKVHQIGRPFISGSGAALAYACIWLFLIPDMLHVASCARQETTPLLLRLTAIFPLRLGVLPHNHATKIQESSSFPPIFHLMALSTVLCIGTATLS